MTATATSTSRPHAWASPDLPRVHMVIVVRRVRRLAAQPASRGGGVLVPRPTAVWTS
jgi:hypothetical protein